MHTLEIDGVSFPLRVVRFTGAEALSELFHFAITVVTAESALDLAGVSGQAGVFTLSVPGGSRAVRGIVQRVEAGEPDAERGATYHIDFVPPHYVLTLRRDVRVFQDESAVDVVKKVVEGAGLELRTALQGSYSPREYCVQYRETDWDFISRLCEDEGITLFFEAGESSSVLVLADAPASHPDIEGAAAVLFRPPTGGLVGGDQVSMFRWSEEVRSGRSTLRDYNFKKPFLLVEGTRKERVNADLEVYDYPGLHDSPTTGATLARIRQEAEESRRTTAQAESNCARLVPGAVFELVEHPRDEVNQRYLVTRLLTEGHDPQMFASGGDTPFRSSLEVARADRQYRPARITPRPRVFGLQTAVVVGPKGEEIYVDDFGRVKVQFHWDRLGNSDEKSSCWIRVSQPWAGAGFGAIHIPRVGHEVVIGFLEGDPDRPIITGSVYHGANTPPYPLPADKTRTAIRTRSSPGGGGYNELRFEDRAGLEEVFLRAQRDLNAQILHDRTELVGHDEKVEVDSNRTHTVGVNAMETVGVDKTVKVGANHTEVVGANLTVSVGANVGFTGSGGMTATFAGDTSTIIEGEVKREIHKSQDETVGGSRTQKVSGDDATSVKGAYELKVEKDATVSVAGNASETVDKEKLISVKETYTLECGDGRVVVQKNGDILIEGKTIKIKGSGPITVEGSKLKIKSEGTVDVSADGTVKVKGSNVDLN
ncbi:MAG: type VI secretion system tip protein TssI/VgrG [Polyangiaceae bacterium]